MCRHLGSSMRPMINQPIIQFEWLSALTLLCDRGALVSGSCRGTSRLTALRSRTGNGSLPADILTRCTPAFGPISDVPNYIGDPTWSLQIFLRTSTETLKPQIRATPNNCFH